MNFQNKKRDFENFFAKSCRFYEFFIHKIKHSKLYAPIFEITFFSPYRRFTIKFWYIVANVCNKSGTGQKTKNSKIAAHNLSANSHKVEKTWNFSIFIRKSAEICKLVEGHRMGHPLIVLEKIKIFNISLAQL